MNKARNHLWMAFDSRPENVGLARIAVAAFASQLDFTVSDLDDIKGAVSEAVSNAIIHGYPGQDSETIRLEAIINKLGLEVTIEDAGKGIDNVGEAQGSGYSTDPERLGLGFAFMQSFMDEVQVLSVPGSGTKIRMLKRVGGEHAHAH